MCSERAILNQVFKKNVNVQMGAGRLQMGKEKRVKKPIYKRFSFYVVMVVIMLAMIGFQSPEEAVDVIKKDKPIGTPAIKEKGCEPNVGLYYFVDYVANNTNNHIDYSKFFDGYTGEAYNWKIVKVRYMGASEYPYRGKCKYELTIEITGYDHWGERVSKTTWPSVYRD